MYRDFVGQSEETGVIEPRQYAIKPGMIELPLNASERLLINIGNFDKETKDISNVSVKFYSVVDGVDNLIIDSSNEDDEDVEEDGPGLYSIFVDGSFLENPGLYKAVWTWKAQRKSKNFNRRYTVDYFAYFDSSSYYSLDENERFIARAVSSRFADLYDNTLGQSRFNFFEEMQSTFGINRIAEMMRFACSNINVLMQPSTSFAIGSASGPRFPIKWYSVLEMGTYIEVLRHAIRSYIEQPAIAGSPDIPYADRRDYTQRWNLVLEDTKSAFNAQIASMRRDMMNLGGTSILVSGGIYGNVSIGATNALYRGRMMNAYVPVIQVGIQ